MSRNATDIPGRSNGLTVTDDAGGALPPVTSHERDFWRRAVTEARERLELTGHTAPPGVRAEVH